MSLQIDEIIEEAKNLPLIPLPATTAYQEKSSLLTNYVDDIMAAEPSIHALIGNNPLQIMYDNHRHHANLMSVRPAAHFSRGLTIWKS